MSTKTTRNSRTVFNPKIPPDTEHASLIREEAIDWLETNFPGSQTFGNGDILRMAGEHGRRWLVGRLRDHGIGNEDSFNLPTAADALAVLFLRSKGVKFREAVDAVAGGSEDSRSREPRYGGIWNRLIRIALKRMRRRLAARLLGSAVFALLEDSKDHPNCLIIVRPSGKCDQADRARGTVRNAGHDAVYQAILERPAPSCWVLSPFREVLFLDADQLPTRSEVTSRKFMRLRIRTERQQYELLIGTMDGASISPDEATLDFVGRILDVIFLDIEAFLSMQSSQVLEAATVPSLSSTDDLQLWLITQLLESVYPGSLSEISETLQDADAGKVLATSVAKPWEPSPWDPPKALEMLSGYASRVGVPLVVKKIEQPWTSLVESAEPEMRYLESKIPNGGHMPDYSALALPIYRSTGEAMGALYLLLPRIESRHMDVEVRVLSVFSRIIGEIIERQKAASHTAEVSANIATSNVLRHDQFRAALLDILERKSQEFDRVNSMDRDLRLPFLMLSVHSSETDDRDPETSERLNAWLVETLRHLEWRSFVRAHLPQFKEEEGDRSFVGELPGTGVVIALDRLVTKDELDQIRHAFPTVLNLTVPTNAPVRFVAWVLDVPARRILAASDENRLQALADDVENWARDVATVVDDVAQSEVLARGEGEWDEALRRIRRAMRKKGGRNNGYLYRMAAECSFSLGDWPSALKYSQQAVKLNTQELGSGFVRSMCLEGDAHLCMGDPVRAWDLYTEAAKEASTHPMPVFYRGEALLLIARFLKAYEQELVKSPGHDSGAIGAVNEAINELVNGALEDLTSAADLLDRWGMLPASSHYRNFHLVPTLLGQGAAYLVAGSPGPASARLQSARRAFPRDEIFLREYLFARCWEQGVHRQYGVLASGKGWEPLRDRMREAFGEPWQSNA